MKIATEKIKSITGFVKRTVHYVIEMIYPESCIFCLKPVERNSSDRFICADCLKNIPVLPFDKRLLDLDNSVFESYDITGLSIYDYKSIRKTIFLFKYDGFKRYGHILGEKMAQHVINNNMALILSADMVVPIPLWKDKEKDRGFNQAALMAEKFSEMTGIPYDDGIIIRIRDTEPQSGLRKHQRNENIRSAFKVINEEKVVGKKILLVDDIYTTGSTIKECSKNFYALGAEAVMYIALAGAEDYDD